MKLLLDVHHSRHAARRLRDAGFDVIAAADDLELQNLEDDDLLRAATSAGRTVVTENVQDFERVMKAWAATGEAHGGVIFTSPRQFHRGAKTYPTSLVRALEKLIAAETQASTGRVWWLSP